MARVSMWRCLGPCKGHIICVETPVHVGLVADRPKRTWMRIEKGFVLGTLRRPHYCGGSGLTDQCMASKRALSDRKAAVSANFFVSLLPKSWPMSAIS